MMINIRKSFSFLSVAAILSLTACRSQQQLATITPSYTVIEAKTSPESPEMEARLSTYREQLSEKMNVIVGHTDEPMSKGRPESKLGNLISDIILERAIEQSGLEVDYALQNLGGIRIPTLGAGDIRKGLMYEIMPFDNEIVIVKLRGDQVIRMMERIAAEGGIPVSRGVQMTIIDKKIGSLLIKGNTVQPEKEYLVAVNDFMANGGDNYMELVDAPKILTGVLVRDAMTDYFLRMQAQGKSVTAKLERRITD